MNQPQEAIFKFENYRINKFSFSDPENEDQKINIAFNPSGLFIKEGSRFVVQFDFTTSGIEDGKQIISARMIASFKFNEAIELNNIPDYFYKNSIAIVFPYLRAFVSSLTVLANVKPMILPILNLGSLEKTLKENTTSIDVELTETTNGGIPAIE